ncbi:MAG: DOMON-like domain-containing protein [Parasphingopyxis sp.]|uniref:DOMON-like domain-containing protein n=1 Tax=Parasphingopyxis sp. TaxID=1920299 RepID=UPI003FA11806
MGSIVAELIPHPDNPVNPVRSLSAKIERTEASLIEVSFNLEGKVDLIELGNDGPLEEADELWHSTCFEVFAIVPQGYSYCELNFTPSNKWASYFLAGYRNPTPSKGSIVSQIETSWTDRSLRSSALAAIGLPIESNWRIGLSAIIEETDGTKSYWALAHPPGKPDFHHPDCFTLELPPPDDT